MAAKKNTKKKKSRKYLTRAARRTIAALLMVSALIVAAIPATTSRAAEDVVNGAEVRVSKDPFTYVCEINGTGTLSLKKVLVDEGSSSDLDLSGSFTGDDSNTYTITEIASSMISNSAADPLGAAIPGMIENVIAPNVESIGSSAFVGSTKLARYDGNKTRIVGSNAFKGVTTLNNCQLSTGGIDSIGSNAFENTGLGAMPIPAGSYVSYLGKEAFKDSQIGGTVSIPGPEAPLSPLTIDEGVFSGCSKIKSVSFTGQVITIGINAFAGCYDVGSIDLPAGLETIGAGAFSGWRGLTTIKLPGSIKELPADLFADCEKLEEITLENGPTLVDKTSENIIIGVKDSWSSLPSNWSQIPNFRVKGYRNTVVAGEPRNTEAFKFCFYQGIPYDFIDDEGGKTSKYCAITTSGELTQFDVERYYKEVCEPSNSHALILDDTSITRIDSASIYNENTKAFFDGSDVITSIVIDPTVDLKYIEAGTFNKIKTLDYIEMPLENQTEIEDDESKEPVFPTNNPSFFVYGDMRCKTTNSGKNAYEYAMSKSIQFRSSGGNSDGTAITVIVNKDKTLSSIAEGDDISADGKNRTPGIKSIVLPSGIEAIDAELFKNDTELKEIIAASWEGVGDDRAPYGYGLKSLADNQFARCNNLSSVSLPASLYNVGRLPFKECENLKEITIDEKNPYCYTGNTGDSNSIGVLYAPAISSEITVSEAPQADSNFRIVEMLESREGKTYTIPASIKDGRTVESIDEEAFMNNKNLERFNSGESGVDVIPVRCFDGAQSLTMVTLDENVGTINEGAFTNLLIHNKNKQPLFKIYCPSVILGAKKDAVFDYENTTANIPYYFQSTSDSDSIAKICGVKNGEDTNGDNLIWIGVVDKQDDPKKSLSACKIYYNGSKSDDGSYGIRKYTGSEIPWVPGNMSSGDFYVMDGNTMLTSGTDYSMNAIVPAPKAKGNYSFVLTGVGGYEGTLTGAFVINDSGGDDPSPEPTPPAPTPGGGDFVVNFNYSGPGVFKWTGSLIAPTDIVVRSASNNDIILTRNVDYTVAYGDETHDNKSMGINMGAVHIYGINSYKGKSGTSYFSIKKSISENIVGIPNPPGKTIDLTISNGTYDNNNVVSANIVLIDRTTGLTLKEGVDYSVACTKISGKNQAIAIITGMGDYYFDSYTTSRFAITKKKSSSSGSSSSSSSGSSSSSSASSSSSSSSGSSSSSSSSSASSSMSGSSSSAGSNSGSTTTSGGSTYRNGGTVRPATDDELANLLRAAHIDAINGGTADGYQVRITRDEGAEYSFRQALINRYGSLDNIEYYSMDISLLDENGNYVDTTGVTVTMTLPIPDSLAKYGANNKVASVDNGGNLEDLNATYSMLQGRECATFVAPHFSPYGFYVLTNNLDYGVMDSTPKTGDPIHPKWFISIGLAALSIFLFLKKDAKPKANPA